MLSRLMTRKEQFVVGFLGASIAAGAGALYWTQSERARPDPIVIERTEPAPVEPLVEVPVNPATPAEPPQVVVSIQGAVIKPGVYTLDDGSRVTDLIRAAGGLLGADTKEINLAARLIDGTTLTVPEIADESAVDGAGADRPVNPATYTIAGQHSTGASAPQSGAATGGRINLNRATQVELETLPGIGPKLAQQIVQYREENPFKNIDALQDVPGIGPQRFEAIRDLITVE